MPARDQHEYYLKNRDKRIKYSLEYQKEHPEQQNAKRQRPEIKAYQKSYHRKWVKKKSKHFAGYMSMYMRRKRLAIITLLGNKCTSKSCLIVGGCKDIRCLEIDHINNDGCLERKKFSGISAYLYYLRNPSEAKKRLQVLCANCNRIKEYERLELLRN